MFPNPQQLVTALIVVASSLVINVSAQAEGHSRNHLAGRASTTLSFGSHFFNAIQGSVYRDSVRISHNYASIRQHAFQIRFMNSEAFDAQLADAMIDDEEIISVQILFAFDLNAIPPRIDRWLSVIKKSGGTVVLKDARQFSTRGIVRSITDLTLRYIQFVSDRAKYGHAVHYDVELHYSVPEGVKYLLFKRRRV